MSTNRLWQKTFVMLALVVGCSILVEPFPPRSAVRAAPNPAPRAITDAIVAPADDASSPRLTPAILHGGVPVTISVNPPRAPAGQTITVSGQGAPNFGQVRLAVVRDGKMFGIQDVNADRAGTYTTNLPIDGTYPPGPVQLCAFALGLDKAIVACADLVVEQAPNGSLVGQFPLDMAQQVGRLNAEVRLLDAAGSVRYSTALRPDGSFSLPSIAPGAYSYAVVGLVPKLVEMGTTQIEPLKENVLTWAIQQPICTFAEQRKPTTALAVNPSRVEFVHKPRNNGLFRSYVDEPRPFGLYVSGVRNLVTFTAAPQSTAPVQKIIFEFNGVNNQRIERLEVTAAPFAIQFDVGRLPPSRGGRHPFVTVTPVVDGKEQCPSLYDIEVAADPMASPFMQPQNSRTTWDDGAGVYRFEGIVPYVEGLLPAEQTLADVPLLGPIRNKFNAGLAFKGSFDLEGKASLVMAEVRTEAAFLSIPLPIPNNGRVDVTPP